MAPFNDWYHCIEYTNAPWIGERRQRDISSTLILGSVDYKIRPIRTEEQKLEIYFQALSKPIPSDLWNRRRQLILQSVLTGFSDKPADILIATLTNTHLHVLARFPDHRPRHWIGLAKTNATHAIQSLSGNPTLRLWTMPGRITPMICHEHQVQTYRSILNLRYQDASVVSQGNWLNI